MKLLLTIFIVLNVNTVFSQNEIEISNDEASISFYKTLSQNLENNSIENIENSTDRVIRIWKGQEIFTLGNVCTYTKRFTNLKTDETHLYKQNLNVSLDTLSIHSVKSLDIKYYIDCFPTAIEIAENGQYFLKVIGCNEFISSFMNDIYNKQIVSNIENYIQNLPSGEYQNGMTTISINQQISNEYEQSDFYKKVATELSKKEIIIDNPTKQPLILINSQKAYFENVNKLYEQNVKSIQILNQNEGIVYGTSGQNGVIIIITE